MAELDIGQCREDLRTLEESLEFLDEACIMESYLHIASCLRQGGAHSEAIEVLQKMLDVFGTLSDDDKPAFSMFYICGHRDMGNSYRALGWSSEAREKLQAARAGAEEYGDFLRLEKAAVDLAGLLADEGNNDGALAILRQAREKIENGMTGGASKTLDEIDEQIAELSGE